jgi:hypothetical protein
MTIFLAVVLSSSFLIFLSRSVTLFLLKFPLKYTFVTFFLSFSLRFYLQYVFLLHLSRNLDLCCIGGRIRKNPAERKRETEEAEIPDSEEMILAATSLFLDSSRYFIVILKKHILLGGKVVVSSS